MIMGYNAEGSDILNKLFVESDNSQVQAGGTIIGQESVSEMLISSILRVIM